jgi:hypothetical protein
MNNAIVLSVVTLKVIKLINTLISLFFWTGHRYIHVILHRLRLLESDRVRLRQRHGHDAITLFLIQH